MANVLEAHRHIGHAPHLFISCFSCRRPFCSTPAPTSSAPTNLTPTTGRSLLPSPHSLSVSLSCSRCRCRSQYHSPPRCPHDLSFVLGPFLCLGRPGPLFACAPLTIPAALALFRARICELVSALRCGLSFWRRGSAPSPARLRVSRSAPARSLAFVPCGSLSRRPVSVSSSSFLFPLLDSPCRACRLLLQVVPPAATSVPFLYSTLPLHWT